ncbi:MAG TPA: hypothetical protein VLZ83_06685 [Edaphocola sp.]|nr:hypothetical protein [Edaphocola sp.]
MKLDELPNYNVAENYSDVRGWDIKDVNNRIIGKIDHLLVNKMVDRVIYLDVVVDESIIKEGHNTYQNPTNAGVHEYLNEEEEDHLIIPIGMTIIDRNEEVIDFPYELNLIRHYRGDDTINYSNNTDGFYDREEFKNTFYDRDSNLKKNLK